MIYDCIVIGAGAAGLFFAATRKNRGPILLVDRQERPGRKLLLSGGGKCNVTNLSVSPDNYLGQNPIFTRQALSAFGSKDMLDFLEHRNITLEEREHGQIFCRRGAEFLRDNLCDLAKENGAQFRLGERLVSASRLATREALSTDDETRFPAVGESRFDEDKTRFSTSEARFAVELESGRYLARNLLIACGGPAWPRAGSSYLGKKIAQDFGHAYIAPRPALTPLKMPKSWPLHGLQGISLTVTAQAPQGPAFTLPLLFTHGGVSGPATLQASSYLYTMPGLQAAPAPQGGEALSIDFLPASDFINLLAAPDSGKQTPAGLLRRKLPERLAAAVLDTPECAPFKDRKCAELARAARITLAETVHKHRMVPLPPDFGQAESSSGGIDTLEVNPRTMESSLRPGLYFAGEVLDVCGQLGGYNLHWAWASAFAAGRVI